MGATNPVTLDMNKFQPLQQNQPQSQSSPVKLDMSKFQPTQQSQNTPDVDITPDVPGVLPGVVTGALGKLGTEALSGVTEGAAKTVTGLGNLTARVAEKVLHMPEGSLQATGNFPSQPTIAGKTGEVAENVGEYVAGDEGIKTLAKMAQLPEAALALAEKYPKTFKMLASTAKGATVGATQGAAKGAAEGSEGAAEGAKAGAEGGAAGGAAAEAIPALAETATASKMGRGLVNRSVNAGVRDVTYGNPARAIDTEGIWKSTSGDWEKYKDAMRAGQTPEQAAQAAGGRFAQIYGKVSELSPQLDQMLSASPAQISVADVIDKPLDDAIQSLANNRALTSAQKDAAVNEIGELQKSLKEGLGKSMSPLQANEIKQQVGDRVNWLTQAQVPPELQQAYKSIYGSLKNAVNSTVPESAQLNERLTNLLAAKKDIEALVKAEETERGTGITAGTLGAGTWMGRLEAEAGKYLPGLKVASQAARPALRNVLPPLAAGYSRVVLSNGSIATVPSENLQRLQDRDPGLQVLDTRSQQQPQQ